ncbi:hypothetical protein P280DRAFT_27556 [Massarina eburnea CBS 473.64]|uniref:Uncharacterized protein n=1 Tax=Massarina eburnea CBS 473.64 TaxID=1395130 RepID=A0A6A6S111_9PLEO|nr:hypothetical protein P280DRAFT_27556 [Massarina eburnea CBS 473.64]
MGLKDIKASLKRAACCFSNEPASYQNEEVPAHIPSEMTSPMAELPRTHSTVRRSAFEEVQQFASAPPLIDRVNGAPLPPGPSRRHASNVDDPRPKASIARATSKTSRDTIPHGPNQASASSRNDSGHERSSKTVSLPFRNNTRSNRRKPRIRAEPSIEIPMPQNIADRERYRGKKAVTPYDWDTPLAYAVKDGHKLVLSPSNNHLLVVPRGPMSPLNAGGTRPPPPRSEMIRRAHTVIGKGKGRVDSTGEDDDYHHFINTWTKGGRNSLPFEGSAAAFIDDRASW